MTNGTWTYAEVRISWQVIKEGSKRQPDEYGWTFSRSSDRLAPRRSCSSVEEALNAFGSDGWELVSLVPESIPVAYSNEFSKERVEYPSVRRWSACFKKHLASGLAD